ncbi:MaoC family dehydratase [bacterium]|nr:MaoC family dehydratase [bacterium]
MDLDTKKGTKSEYKKTFSDEEVLLFSKIIGDNNPIHVDSKYAAKSIFGKKIIHGVLINGMVSKIFGTQYPGKGSIYLTQNSKFLKPVFVGEEITARVILSEFDKKRNRGVFITECFNTNNEMVFEGNATILFPKTYD